MAYGVKFRLVFSDVKGNLRRVEILQNNYSGNVFPLIGQVNPVVIKWEGDDDFYTPIIGSTCELNLFETDTTVYDQFYRASEQEYKVRISTGLDQDKVWNTENDQWEQANYLWEEENNFEIFWEGWLQTDQYQESLQPHPNPIKLVAYDGLGTLDSYDAPYSNAPDGGFDSNEDTMFFYIHYILNEIQLDLDIYVANSVRKINGLTNDTLYHDIVLNEFGIYDDLDFRNSKDLLESFLKATNSRVFQSQGRWYVVSNSNLIDKNINEQDNLNIGNSIKNQLIDTGEEIIEYKVYDRLGNYKFTTSENILLKAPADLKPVGGDLYKEYLRPYQKVKYNADVTKDFIKNKNPQLLYGDYDYTLGPNTSIYPAPGTVANENFISIGNKSIRTSAFGLDNINYDDPYVIISNTITTDESKKLKVGFSFHVDPDNTQSNFSDVWEYEIGIIVRAYATDFSLLYWNWYQDRWDGPNTSTNEKTKLFKFKKVGTWQNVKLDLKPWDRTKGAMGVTLEIHYPRFTTYPTPPSGVPLINSTYFDKIFIAEVTENASNIILSNTQQGSKKRTAIYEIKDLLISNYLGDNASQGGYGGYFQRPRDFHFISNDSLDRIITQEILNDFRDFVTRYEGTFYNLIDQNIPVSLHNKIWVDFGNSSFRENVSCYIDAMKFDVKSNQFELTMHTPNQTNDVDSVVNIELKS